MSNMKNVPFATSSFPSFYQKNLPLFASRLNFLIVTVISINLFIFPALSTIHFYYGHLLFFVNLNIVSI
ncbi:MAG: hypothetical protein A2W90_03150 [Bacteroidetes bacterium GWF2_42_66]|nr:MAG: hypothetical protein A2W92_10545 [Bacteroidetes bacterium GWA2_42_15]OFY01334.1 MAG: hypothetical protein A2W89_16635 [Bacteroidetes bacterium GWE2_42_39]OFY42178.1 MAG: hypothetical protein A2W90_03150 [Bacteroidetes bacterium GWF2_42_66]HBL77609.1 hypothetical protein [Prolixibacteraceae bacterium]HCB62739.1 hypothetical protein [Bacteroidales bacterium]